MLKINYGSNAIAQKTIEAKYLTYFDLQSFQSDVDSFFKKPSKYHGIKIEEILLAPIDKLLKLSTDLKSLGTKKLDDLKAIFNYDKADKAKYRGKQQPSIARFFSDNDDKISLSTCYYCNIDYINVTSDINHFWNLSDFFQNGRKEDFVKIARISDKTAKIIVKERKNGTQVKALPIKRDQLYNLTNMVLKDKYYHFTLDHVLDKANHPIAALSLYNFVPCCYNCNSRFKGSKALVSKSTQLFLSPTSDSFNFNNDVSFQLLLSPNHRTFKGISDIKDFALSFKIYNKIDYYEHYVETFRLDKRYVFHKREILNIIEKRKKYSNTQIKEIARITRKSANEVKKDIFGDFLVTTELEANPLSKLKTDIAKSLGL